MLARHIFVLQLKKGMKEGEMTFVMAIALEDMPTDKNFLPKEVCDLLKEFQDIMPLKLPNNLSPKRDVDHQIDLELDAKPPACAKTD